MCKRTMSDQIYNKNYWYFHTEYPLAITNIWLMIFILNNSYDKHSTDFEQNIRQRQNTRLVMHT